MNTPAILTALALALATFSPSNAAQSRQPAAATHPTAVSADDGETYFRRGRDLHSRGRYEEAVKTFEEYLKQHPRAELSDLMLLWQGRAQHMRGRNNEAVKTARRLRQMGSHEFADLLELEILRSARGGKRQSRVLLPPAAQTPRK